MEIIIQELLKQIHKRLQLHSETPLLDAQVLIAHHLEKPRTWVLAHPEAVLNSLQSEKIFQSTLRLEAGEPLPYILGHWEFFGLDFQITPDVLIPRPETELIVETAISWLRSHPHKRKMIDVGTGSGCIAIAIARNFPDLRISITDVSAQALRVARLNAEKYALLDSVELIQSNLLEQVPTSSNFDLICANLPYIPTKKLASLPVARSEPLLALDGGVNGLMIIEHLFEQVKTHLSPGGLILVEIDPDQRIQMIHLLREHFPTAKFKFLQDLSANDRCVAVQLPFLVYHICTREDWQNAQGSSLYKASSLNLEGFIHCSEIDQVIDVANRYYKGVPDLIVLSINPDKLTSEIRWEKSGDIYYPHVYGPINLNAVVSIKKLILSSKGTFQAILPKLETN